MNSASRNKKTTPYGRLRAKMIARGFSLRKFALTHGYSIPTVYMAAQGKRSGVVSVGIQKKIEEVLK